MQKLKIQEKKKIPENEEKIKDGVKVFFRNLILVSLLCDPVIMKLTAWRGNVYNENVPELIQFAVIFPMILVVRHYKFVVLYRIPILVHVYM